MFNVKHLLKPTCSLYHFEHIFKAMQIHATCGSHKYQQSCPCYWHQFLSVWIPVNSVGQDHVRGLETLQYNSFSFIFLSYNSNWSCVTDFWREVCEKLCTYKHLVNPHPAQPTPCLSDHLLFHCFFPSFTKASTAFWTRSICIFKWLIFFWSSFLPFHCFLSPHGTG